MDEWIVIGCPVYKREWVLPRWFDAIEEQDFPLTNVGFVFVTAQDDTATLDALLEFSSRHPELRCFDLVTENSVEHKAHAGERHIRRWNRKGEYNRMVVFRNRLLNQVVCHDPDRFFSLDSDILLEDPTTISQLVKLTGKYDAVSPLMIMHPKKTFYKSVMTWREEPGGLAYRRQNYRIGGVFRSDIIMAGVMMSRPVYQTVRYQAHRLGEDLGWSADADAKGFKLWCASDIYAPHIMSPPDLRSYLSVGDLRKSHLLGAASW